METEFLERGWIKFDVDEGLLEWLDSVQEVALATLDHPAQSKWLRHQRTWFAGVNALPNDPLGAIAGGPDLPGQAIALARGIYGDIPLDRAQVSVVFPGYPKQDPTESDGAHRFRKVRDAAHIDGLKPVGPKRRRYLDEYHAYLLGYPLGETRKSPLVVWDQSHEVARRAFQDALADHPESTWGNIDITDVYTKVRRKIFDTCERIEIPATRGQATLMHRLTLHGVAPWGEAGSTGEARAILYFRPALPGGAGDWLALP